MQHSSTTSESPRWPGWVSGGVCLAGVVVAAYLTYAHYTSPSVLACSDKGLVDCAKVTTSSYSQIFGVPVADAGLAYFAVMGGLCSPWAWSSAHRGLRLARVLGSLAGVGMVLWLIYVELFRLDAICLYCTIVHALTVLLFITVSLGTATYPAGGPPPQQDRDDTRWLATGRSV